VRGLVLNGVFTVIQNEKPVHYRPGDIFFVANGDLHCEEIGAAGAEICVGKRY
jgi:hypothetical protein